MKKWIATLALMVGLSTMAYCQSFQITNTYTLQSTVDVVHTIDFGNMTNVVSSAGAPVTNSSLWGLWIPDYIDACIYTNGLSTNNVTDIRVEWMDPRKKATYQARYIHQGMPDIWDGFHYIKLPLAKERILAGQRLHVWLAIQDGTTILTNATETTNVIYSAAGVMKKVIVIPESKPAWLP